MIGFFDIFWKLISFIYFLDAPWDIKRFGDQVDWLKKDLAAANTPQARAQQPWIVVLGHRPIYSSAEGYSYDGVPANAPIKEIPINCAQVF